MIIKSKSYKTKKSFTTVIDYILRETERDNSFILTKFIKGKEYATEEISRQLKENEEHRIHRRKNNVRLYMDILSFHPKDRKKLTNKKLKKIARKYIALRAPNAIAVATVHRSSKEHIHLHICLSGVEYKNGKAIRISKGEFKQVKENIENYQRSHFPELNLSEINHEPCKLRKKKLLKEVDYGFRSRYEISEREQIINTLDQVFLSANSEQDFYSQLQQKGLTLYSRGGHIAGIKAKSKYRLRTLGFTPEIVKELSRDMTKSKRLETLERIKGKREKNERNRTR